jgi:DUF2934 family protein
MNTHLFGERPLLMFTPEHGGSAVKGGGHPSDSPVHAQEEIEDALGRTIAGRTNITGSPDRGVPGSKTNPVHKKRPAPARAERRPENPSKEEISMLAWQFWQEEGRPEGKAEEHWRRAEEQLHERGSNSSVRTSSRSAG